MKVLKGIFFFLRIKHNYNKEKARYEKLGYFGKILTLLLSLLFPAIAIGSTYCSVVLIKGIVGIDEGLTAFLGGNFLRVVGAIFCLYLALSFAFHAITFYLQYAIIAFKSASQKKRLFAGQKEPLAVENKKVESLGFDNASEEATFVEKDSSNIIKMKPKTSRGFDIVMGAFGLLFLAGTIIGIAVMFIV